MVDADAVHITGSTGRCHSSQAPAANRINASRPVSGRQEGRIGSARERHQPGQAEHGEQGLQGYDGSHALVVSAHLAGQDIGRAGRRQGGEHDLDTCDLRLCLGPQAQPPGRQRQHQQLGGSGLDALVKDAVLPTLVAHTHPVSGAVAIASTDPAMITLATDPGNKTQKVTAQ